jgi:hypothetical protein
MGTTGRRGPRIYNGNCGFGCYFAAETARRGRRRPFAKGGPAMLPAPLGGSNEPGHWASESLALARSGRQLHNSVLLPKPDLFGIGAR